MVEELEEIKDCMERMLSYLKDQAEDRSNGVTACKCCGGMYGAHDFDCEVFDLICDIEEQLEELK